MAFLQNPFGGLAGLPNFAVNNPVAAAANVPNLANAAQINPSKPVLRTETVFTTKSVPIFFGNKKMYTTVTSAVGVTTLTDYVADTAASTPNTVNPAAGLSPVGAYNPLGGLALQPSFTVTSQPVIRETVLPSTITKEVRITFRNTPTLTTLTSTKMVSTQVTQYVTKTVRVTPSIGAGFGANPFAALLG